MRRISLLVATALSACSGAETPAVDAFTPSTNPLLGNGRPADSVVGQLSFEANANGTTTGAGVSAPSAIATRITTENEIEIWVVDAGNRRVLGWRTDSAGALADGASAQRVIGQADVFRTDDAQIDPEELLANPVHVAVDDAGNVYVANVTTLPTANEVRVYERPFETDTLVDFRLDEVINGFGPVKVVPFQSDLLAVHDRERISFYRQGLPARITDQSGLGGSTVFLKPTSCAAIASVAGGPTNFFVGCTQFDDPISITDPCPVDASVITPAADCTNELGVSACYTAGCGVIYAFSYNLDDPNDPNADIDLPVQNSLPPVFSGFAVVQDMQARLGALFVSDNQHRVIRLSTADPAATVLRARLELVTTDTQNIWENPIVSTTDPSLDRAFGQLVVRDFIPNRGADALTGDLGPSSLDIPTAISLDPTNRLFVIDEQTADGDARILGYNDAASVGDSVADLVLGQANFDGAAENAPEPNGFGLVESVALDWASGALYVSDSEFNRVLQFDTIADGTGSTASRAIGQRSLTGFRANDGQTINSNRLSGPSAVYVDNR
ncbi:MAG: hypothetical protein AAF658_05915, partial [Myxococcota bacterium]